MLILFPFTGSELHSFIHSVMDVLAPHQCSALCYSVLSVLCDPVRSHPVFPEQVTKYPGTAMASAALKQRSVRRKEGFLGGRGGKNEDKRPQREEKRPRPSRKETAKNKTIGNRREEENI